MTVIHRSIGALMRMAATLAAGLAVAACVDVPAPKLGPGPPPLVSMKTLRTLGPAPVKGADARFAFATVTGVPADMRFSLEASLKHYAATRSVTMVPIGDAAAVYQVKGYLSAVGDISGTVLVFVWDVSDAFGTPLYRISGQETGNGSGTDPWLGITNDNIDAAARETIDKLAEWIKG